MMNKEVTIEGDESLKEKRFFSFKQWIKRNWGVIFLEMIVAIYQLRGQLQKEE